MNQGGWTLISAPSPSSTECGVLCPLAVATSSGHFQGESVCSVRPVSSCHSAGSPIYWWKHSRSVTFWLFKELVPSHSSGGGPSVVARYLHWTWNTGPAVMEPLEIHWGAGGQRACRRRWEGLGPGGAGAERAAPGAEVGTEVCGSGIRLVTSGWRLVAWSVSGSSG